MPGLAGAGRRGGEVAVAQRAPVAAHLARLPAGRDFGPRSKSLQHTAITSPHRSVPWPFRLFYLAAGKRSLSPEEFTTIEDATRAMNFLKARGITAWVEDDTGKFVPVKGVRRKPPSVD